MITTQDFIDNLNITNETLFVFIIISISILFFFTNIVKIDSGHILALFATIIVLSYLTIYQTYNVDNLNKQLEFKLNSLLDDELPPEYFYINADLIEIFYNIKINLAKYNYTTYRDAVISTNIVLNIQYDVEQKLCKQPIPPDLSQNFEVGNFKYKQRYEYVDDNICNDTLVNIYENYKIAEQYLQKTMNSIQSMIISIPSEPVIHRYHDKIMKQLHILLKRTLDIIKIKHDKSIKNNINVNTKMITDYDLPKPANTLITNDIINNKFYS